jgi:hypothetical protein
LTKNGDGDGGTRSHLDCTGSTAVVGGPQGKAKAGQRGYIMGSFGLGAVDGLDVTWVASEGGTWTKGTPGAVAGGKAALGR